MNTVNGNSANGNLGRGGGATREQHTAIGSGVNNSAVNNKAYPYIKGLCALNSVNTLCPHTFYIRVRKAIIHYPYLRTRIVNCLQQNHYATDTLSAIAESLLDAYLGRELDSVGLRMLDEIMNLSTD